MSGQPQLVPFAIKSYRYLRLSIVVVVAALMASVLLEVYHAGCWQESISAYYYTPTHSIFVGGLVAIGVALIAVNRHQRGSTHHRCSLAGQPMVVGCSGRLDRCAST